jgi:hypothetical protein
VTEWTRVKWSEARQIVRVMGKSAQADAPGAEVTPQAWFEQLRTAQRLDEAAAFLGHALPRYEAVAWAARSVRDLRDPEDRNSPEAAAIKAALLWVADPTEPRRRAAQQAAEAADTGSAERLAALAVFASGGSLGPAEFDPVPAPRDLAGVLAGSAVRLAASAKPDRQAALASALDAGARLAAGQAGADVQEGEAA